MKVLVAPDSFKECLSAGEVAAAIAKGILEVIPEAEVFQVPISDGGEGVLDAIKQAVDIDIVPVSVSDPLLRPLEASFGMINGTRTAVIEMARVSGLELLLEHEKDPLITSTFGTGQCILKALDKGSTKIIIGIGGSATNDGGAGIVRALGGKFLDAQGVELKDGGGSLGHLAQIDLSNFDKRIYDCDVQIACDVLNPLIGENGASLVYGKQKGGSKAHLELLDKNLGHYADIVEQSVGIDIRTVPGAGAAGGAGAALMAFLNGRLVKGVDLVLKTIGIEKFIKDVDLIITGEGQMDEQTLNGKAIMGLATMAKQHNIPIIALTGRIKGDMQDTYNIGVNAMFSIVDQPMSLQEAIDKAPLLLQNCTVNLMRMIQCFIPMAKN